VHVTTAALHARRAHPGAFIGETAGYIPLPSSSGHAVVFARTHSDEPRVITVATRLGIELDRLGGWGEHTVTLPAGDWRDALTGAEFEGDTASLAAILKTLPVALLERR
jgi:(1->4)-alpha-D-glucan 1-alpha-D-glucosylmutase